MSAPCVWCGRPEAEHGPPGASPLGGPGDRLCPAGGVSSQFYTAAPAPVRWVTLKLDDDDYRSLHKAFARRLASGVLPEGGGNLAGRLAAEICRGWLEMLDHRPRREA
jgi:hypothetical protein